MYLGVCVKKLILVQMGDLPVDDIDSFDTANYTHRLRTRADKRAHSEEFSCSWPVASAFVAPHHEHEESFLNKTVRVKGMNSVLSFLFRARCCTCEVVNMLDVGTSFVFRKLSFFLSRKKTKKGMQKPLLLLGVKGFVLGSAIPPFSRIPVFERAISANI